MYQTGCCLTLRHMYQIFVVMFRATLQRRRRVFPALGVVQIDNPDVALDLENSENAVEICNRNPVLL